MNQLFVAHTQYNLILSAGLALDSFNYQSDLILIADFALTDELKLRLQNVFSDILYLPGNFPKAEQNLKKKIDKMEFDSQAIMQFMIKAYDRVFIVDDMNIPEMNTMKCAMKKNPTVELAWLEDGGIAYFPNDNIFGRMRRNTVKKLLRCLFFKLRFSLFGIFDQPEVMGGHKLLKNVYAVYPCSLLPELRNKKVHEITQKQIENGMNTIFAEDEYQMDDDCVVIAVDKIDTYGDKYAQVNKVIEDIVKKSKHSGKTVYCKYHPRETEKMEALEECIELDSKIAIEYYLINTTAKSMTVVGVKSTALQMAKKMGFSVISLVGLIEGSQAPAAAFYLSIGIDVK